MKAIPKSQRLSGAPSRESSALTVGMRRALVALLGIGTLLRVRGLSSDFWLDEVYSLLGVRQLRSLTEVFTLFLSDNNHILNSVYLYLLRSQTDWRVFRLLSLVAGVLTIAAAWAVGRSRGPAGSLSTALLFAVSYPLVWYSSEARGYALAVLLALTSVLALRRFRRQPGLGTAAPFWAAVATGFLAHVVFVHVYAGLVAWSLVRPRGEERPGASGRRALAVLHVVPGAFLALFYFGFVRRIALGEGPLTSAGEIAAKAVALALALPEQGLWLALAVVAAASILVGEVGRLRREGDGTWAFFVVAVVVSPLVLTLFATHSFLQPRYFLLPIAMFLVLLGSLLGRLWNGAGPGRRAAVGIAMAFAALSVGKTVAAYRTGRGGCRAAVELIASESHMPRVSVGGDHDVWNQVLVRFHGTYVPGSRIDYVPGASWPPGGTDWYVVNRIDPSSPAPVERIEGGVSYRLRREYPCRGLSGSWWAVYRKD